MSLDGNIIWHQVYRGSNEYHCFGMDINNEGDIFLTGHTLSNVENWDTYAINLNNDGDLMWQQTSGNPRGFNPQYIHDEAWDIKATNDDGYVVIAGTGDEYGNYSECDEEQCSDTWNAYLIILSSEGEIEWSKTFSSIDVSNEYYGWAGETIALFRLVFI